MRKINQIIIHCSDSEFGTVEMIRQWHKDERGFKNIGYHFIIYNGRLDSTMAYTDYHDGLIKVGRDIAEIGAHVKGHNKNSIGICLIGKEKFTDNQLSTAEDLIQSLQKTYDIPCNQILGHYEFDATKTCPNFNMGWFRNLLQGR